MNSVARRLPSVPSSAPVPGVGAAGGAAPAAAPTATPVSEPTAVSPGDGLVSCSFTRSGETFVDQHWYYCYTCGLQVQYENRPYQSSCSLPNIADDEKCARQWQQVGRCNLDGAHRHDWNMHPMYGCQFRDQGSYCGG
jgi:hypothetical protein